MNRPLVWGLAPSLPIFILALQYWGIRSSPDLPDMWTVWMLLGSTTSAVIGFGVFPGRRWLIAGVGAAGTVFVLNFVALKLNIAWRVGAGVPESWLLQLHAVAALMIPPVALFAGGLAAVLSGRRWLLRD